MKKNIDWIFYLSEGLVKSFKIISLVISVRRQKYLLFEKPKKIVTCTYVLNNYCIENERAR